MTPEGILQATYQKAKDKQEMSILHPVILERIQVVVAVAETQKAVVGALITSLVKKIETPAQDIRMHQKKLKGGYSARSYDTKYITPFLQRHFPRYAMAESAWLTRSLEQPHPFTLDFPGEIRNEALKQAFLHILDHVQNQPHVAKDYLEALFRALFDQHQPLITANNQSTQETTVSELVRKLKAHFSLPRSSRLPVLALYAVYTCLIEQPRYQNKVLMPLKSHTTADAKSKGMGDIEVVHQDGKPFEAIEIKHGKPITTQIILQAYETKIASSPIERYYFLTTHEPNSAEDVQSVVQDIRLAHGCEVIVNGVLPSLKYYLRLLASLAQFQIAYENALARDYEVGRIERQHITAWQEL